MIFLRRKRVRVHQRENPTIEGILVSSLDDHYRLIKPSLLVTPEQSYELEGEAWIPRERVVFLEVLR